MAVRAGTRGALLLALSLAPLAPAFADSAILRQLAERYVDLPVVRELQRDPEAAAYTRAELKIVYPWLDAPGIERVRDIYLEEYNRVDASSRDVLIEAMIATYTENDLRAMIRAYRDPAFADAARKASAFEEAFFSITQTAFTQAQDRAMRRMTSEGLMDGYADHLNGTTSPEPR